MRPVIQEEETGCGIATVAAVVGKSYEEVKKTANNLNIYAKDEKLFSDTGYVRRLLSEYGVSVSEEECQFSSWNALPDTALLSIKYHVEDGKPFWHWVVFNREDKVERVLDPAAYLEQNVRTDFENMKPEWFIEVYRSF